MTELELIFAQTEKKNTEETFLVRHFLCYCVLHFMVDAHSRLVSKKWGCDGNIRSIDPI